MAHEKINILCIDAIFFLKKTLLFYAYGYFAFIKSVQHVNAVPKETRRGH